MADSYQVYAKNLKTIVERNFKPFSELVDCRRYNFPRYTNMYSRALENLNYFCYNYAAVSLCFALYFLISHLLFAIAFFATILFWTMMYFLEKKLNLDHSSSFCYNSKMSLCLFANIALIYAFYSNEPAQCIGYMVIPVVLHACLFEPVSSVPQTQIDEETNRRTSLSEDQNYIHKQFKANPVTDIVSLSPDSGLTDEMAQAYKNQYLDVNVVDQSNQ